MTRDNVKNVMSRFKNEPPEDVKNDSEKLADCWCTEPQEDSSKKLVRAKFIHYRQERGFKGVIPFAYYVSGSYVDDEIEAEWVSWQEIFSNGIDPNLSDEEIFKIADVVKRLANS